MVLKRLLALLTIALLGVSIGFHSFRKFQTIKMSVIFTEPAFTPLISGEINGKKVAFMMDSGAGDRVSILQPFLNHISKTELKKLVTFLDLKSNEYRCKTYTISNLKIGPLEYPQLEIIEEPLEFHQNTNLLSSKKISRNPCYQGRIGWQFFQDKTALFNFPNSEIVLAKTLSELEEDRFFDTKDFIKIPLKVNQGVLFVEVTTNLGLKKAFLDTGTSFCSLRTKQNLSSPITKTSPLNISIEGTDFGDWRCVETTWTETFEGDLILGVDFFLENAICFDFPNNTVYFKKPRGPLATQWQRGKYYVTQFFLKTVSDLPPMEEL